MTIQRLVTFALATAALAAAAASPAAGSVATERADAALERALAGLVARPLGPPGAVAVIQRGSRVQVHTAGVADVRTRRKIRATDKMRLASTSKAFSGAVALALVNTGELALDDTIGSRLAGQGLPAAWAGVTLAQALHHTGGLPDYTRSAPFQRALGANLKRRFDSRKLWQFVADKPLEFAPGSSYRYSNTDNIIVALMAEAASGQTYEQLLSELAYRPLGLRGTSMPVGTAMPSPYIRGYLREGRKPPQNVSELLGASGVWASGGMVSTPADLNRFARGLAGAKLFSRAVQRRQMAWRAGTSEPPGPGVNSAGLAIFRYRTRCGTVYGHTGNFPGYTQFLASTLDGRRSVTVSVNEQLSQEAELPAVWRVLRAAEETAVCAALAR